MTQEQKVGIVTTGIVQAEKRGMRNMDHNQEEVERHYGSGGIMEKIKASLKVAGKDLDALSVDDLAPIDEFHTRGRESTLELAALASVGASDSVLDVGCGLGGTARYLADRYQCSVVGLDLTQEFIATGQKLTQLVGLHDRVTLRQGSALDISEDDATFDIVWTEHVQMNIADKHGFYSEIARVLKPGGRFVFHDVFRGTGDPPLYPAPWAEGESISRLATEREIQSTLQEVGLRIAQWKGKNQESIEFFQKVSTKMEDKGLPPLGIHLLMGNNAREKFQNNVRNLIENRTTVVMGLTHKV